VSIIAWLENCFGVCAGEVMGNFALLCLESFHITCSRLPGTFLLLIYLAEQNVFLTSFPTSFFSHVWGKTHKKVSAQYRREFSRTASFKLELQLHVFLWRT